jgi:hypothetical protein
MLNYLVFRTWQNLFLHKMQIEQSQNFKFELEK